jgi:type IV pilus assembly protein PilQ
VTTLIEPSFTTFLGNITDNVPPPISTRHLKSTVRLKDGETIILGGLIENRNFTDQNGIPWVSRIPLLGALFRNHQRTENRSELVIYMTPHIYFGNEGSVEFIREEEGLNYQLDVVRQKRGIDGHYPKKKRWFQRSRQKDKERQPEVLEDPKDEKKSDS